jgi:hypothetical protein
MSETLPEREGWVDRERLLDLNGRGRKPQIALAHQFGFDDYAQPAGGCCFLTDEAYSHKLADLWSARGERRYELDDIMLLKVGRHLRPRPHFKLIIGREDGENRFMDGYRKQFTHLYPVSHLGPLALVDGEANDADLELAGRIIARYSQGRDASDVTIAVNPKGGASHEIHVAPIASDDMPQEWFL